LDVGVQDPQHPDWTPDGSHMVFDAIDADGQRRIYVTHTAFYLQRVRNLQRFPELLGAGRSTLLDANGLVARLGSEKEFFEGYEKLRYQDRPQFITIDAALQAYRDEFVHMLRA